jgi:acyl-coenzyme A synthetase/AMP-(fatty) acid ligase
VHYKVPHRIVFVTELPRGPTGKLQRIGLAAKLGLCA